MKRPRRGARAVPRILAGALLALLASEALGPGRAAAQKVSPSDAKPKGGAPIFVTMPENEAAAKRQAESRTKRMTEALNREIRARKTPVAIGVLTAVVALIFVVAVLFALRRRAKVCPSCFSLLHELGDPADAGEDLLKDEMGDGRPLLACLGCGEIGMLRGGLFYRSGGQCPKCHRWDLASRFKVVQPSTYLMFGLARVEEACACGYEARFLRSTEPNRAPLPEFAATNPYRT